MSAYPAMREVRWRLESRDVPALLPAIEDELHAGLSENAFLDFKRAVSRAYLKEIRRQTTSAILVVNPVKRGIENYIGANTFAEIAMAFDARKPIYLLYDHFEPFRDELIAWRATALRGDVSPLVRAMASQPARQAQMRLPLVRAA